MTINYTTLLGLALPVTGTESGTWGDDVSLGITDYLDIAVAGTNNITNDSDITLSITNGSSAGSNIVASPNSTTAQYMQLLCTGSRTAIRNINCPESSKMYVVSNSTSGGYAIVVRGYTTGPSYTTGVTIANGEKCVIFWSSVSNDFIKITSSIITNLTGTLLTSNGGTGLSSYTAGDLPYYATGTALSKLGIGTNGQILTSSGTAPQWSTLSGVAVTTFSAGTTGFTPSSATSGAITLAGTLATTNGGTGLTSFTANGVVYASSTSALTTGSALTFDGTNLATSGGVILNNAQYYYGKYSGGSNVRLMGINSSDVFYLGIDTGPTSMIINASATSTNIQFNASGSEQMRLNSTGLGIGTSSPNTKLDVLGSSGDQIRVRTASTEFYRFGRNASTGYMDFYGSQTGYQGYTFGGIDGTWMTLSSAGNLGLGVTPSAWTSYKALQVSGSAYLYGLGDSELGLGQGAYYSSGWKYAATGVPASWFNVYQGLFKWNIAPSGTAGNAITFTQAMTLDNSGNLLVGTTSTFGAGTGNFYVTKTGDVDLACFWSQAAAGNGTAQYIRRTNTGNFLYFVYGTSTNVGSISTNGTTTTYNVTSDYRLKTVVGAVSGSGERIDALQPIEYEWKSDGSRTRGFLAHQFQEVYAGSVSGTKDAVDAEGRPVYQAMQASTSEVIADLVAEIQSLRKRLADAGIA